MNKTAYIMRGVPGSGKSTVTRILIGTDTSALHSTDEYFYHNGKYQFDPKMLPAFHDKNFFAFCCSLQLGRPIVICDNTNIKKSHYIRYANAEKKAGYTVVVLRIPNPTVKEAVQRNLHGVPELTIIRMIREFEEGE